MVRAVSDWRYMWQSTAVIYKSLLLRISSGRNSLPNTADLQYSIVVTLICDKYVVIIDIEHRIEG